MADKATGARSLRLADFSDLALMQVVEDTADREGWTTASTVAQSLDVSLRSVTSRFSWLRTWNMLDREYPHHWRLSDEGLAMLRDSRLTQAQVKAIEDMPEGRVLGTITAIGQRPTTRSGAKLAAREFRHHDMRRP